jgi:dolichol kinase
MEQEMKRKVVHISMGLWTLIVGFLPRLAAMIIVLIAFTLCFFFFRPNSPLKFGRAIFEAISREKDRKLGYLYAPTIYIIMVFLLITFVDYRIAATSFAILAFGDGFAAVVGIKLGKHRFFGDKSLEGTGAFITASFIFGSFIFLLVDFFMIDSAAGLSLIDLLIISDIYRNNLTQYFPLILAMILFVACITSIIELITPQRVIDDNITIPLTSSVIMWVVMRFLFPVLVAI